MKKQCIIIGLGRFGSSVAENLYKIGNDVLAIDLKEENVRYISNQVTHAIQADIKEDGVLETLGLNYFDVAVVAIGEDVESSCMAIIALKKHGVKYIIAKAKNATSGTILKAVGADKVIYPERDMGARVAHNISAPNILDFLEFSDEHSIAEIEAPSWSLGKTLIDLNIRDKYNINVVAIKRGLHINAEITRDTLIKENDILIVIGKDKNILNFN